MIIKRLYETRRSSVAVAYFLPGRAKDLSAPLYIHTEVLISPEPDLLHDVFCLVVRIFRLMLILLYIYIYIVLLFLQL